MRKVLFVFVVLVMAFTLVACEKSDSELFEDALVGFAKDASFPTYYNPYNGEKGTIVGRIEVTPHYDRNTGEPTYTVTGVLVNGRIFYTITPVPLMLTKGGNKWFTPQNINSGHAPFIWEFQAGVLR